MRSLTVTNSLYLGVGSIIAGAGILLLTMDYPSSPAMWPRILGWLLIILGLAEIFLENKVAKSKDKESDNNSLKKSLVIMGLTLLYVIGIPVIGFFTLSTVLLLVSFFYMKVKLRTNIFTTVFLIAFVYVFFVTILGMNFPKGILI